MSLMCYDRVAWTEATLKRNGKAHKRIFSGLDALTAVAVSIADEAAKPLPDLRRTGGALLEVLETHGQGAGTAAKENGPQAPPPQRLQLPPATGGLSRANPFMAENGIPRLCNVFIPTARTHDDDELVLGQPGRAANNFRDRMGAFQGGDDTFEARKFGERTQRLVAGRSEGIRV